MDIVLLLVITAICPWLIMLFYKACFTLHILQLESYKNEQYTSWILSNLKKLAIISELSILSLLAGISLIIYFYYLNINTFYLFLVLWTAGISFLIYNRDKKPVKKPLVFTARVIRLMIIFWLVLAAELSFFIWLHPYAYSQQVKLKNYLLLFFTLVPLTLITPLNILLANYLAAPLEKAVKLFYFKSAQRKIRDMPDLTVIAVTGSYGKTSTKYITHSLLSPYYITLMTPESYNTPMGICKVIRGQLNREHKYFIVEMGARQAGDIKELCELVNPKIGVITAIGPQHLETFGSIDNIINTKFELIEHLDKNGLAIFNGDDPNCRKMAQRTTIPYKLYGIKDIKTLDLYACDITTGRQVIKFKTCCKDDGKSADFSVPLLGRHNTYNVLAAATVALECGLHLSHIVPALKLLNPIPHRLQLIQGGGGITIIDDAYNSNPRGAAEALTVLQDMDGGKKILVTPGMVELGTKEFEENKKFGIKAAEVCDIVILVGKKRTIPISEGLKESLFPKENLFVTASLTEAAAKLKQLAKTGDIVLFENDLPDNYDE